MRMDECVGKGRDRSSIEVGIGRDITQLGANEAETSRGYGLRSTSKH